MLIELHAHTKEVSSCGHIYIEEVIDRYHAKGYDAVVITNHLNNWTVGTENSEKDWDEFIENFCAPVKKGREYAKKYGMKVFLGCELRFCDDENDYLVYGITEDFLKENPDIRTLGIGKFHSIAEENGLLIFQAHPFRDNMKITPAKYLHGIEVNNGHPRQNSRNDIARLWADMHGMRMISGSDFHDAGDEAHGGIVTFRDVENERDLCDILLSGEYILVCDTAGGLARKN